MKDDTFSIIIPARLNSVRFKNKIIYKIKNLEMIEHVRRRAELSKINKRRIYIATNNKIISNLVKKSSGNVIITKKRHRNGTSRVSEIINKIKTKYVIVLQGDEPLIRPNDLNKIYKEVLKFPNYNVYNTVSELMNNELKDKSVVKCEINSKKEITNFFRINKKANRKLNCKKILGILIFDTKVLEEYSKLKKSTNEIKTSIEQFKFLDNKFKIKSINLKESTQSVNYLKDVKKVCNLLEKDIIQKKIFESIDK